MAKAGQAQDEAMDAILASIRSMMSDDERGVQPAEPEASVELPPDNVSKLFAEARPPASLPRREIEVDETPAIEPAASELDGAEIDAVQAAESDRPTDPAVERAMARAMEEAQAEVERGEPAEDEEPVREAEPSRPAAEPASPPSQPDPVPIASEPVRPAAVALPRGGASDRPTAPPLLSPHADAAVSGAFNELATSMLSGSGRTIDELVEDLLRPMLRDWLDDNLPPMVERLVREEIERVSRGRR